MTTGMRRPSVQATATWLLTALLTVALACASAAGTGIATAGGSKEAAPADTNPPPVDPQNVGRVRFQSRT